MALTRNGQRNFETPGKLTGSVTNSTGNIIKGGFRNRMVGGLNQTFGGYANGQLSPSSFVLPTKDGSISSYVEGHIAVTQNTVILIPGLSMAGAGAITITVANAQLDATFPMVASGSIVVAVDSAALAAAVNASASGTITVTGTAQLGGIFDLLASGTITTDSDAFLSALAWIEAEAGGPTPLSPEGLANAVWQAQAVDQNDPGTMGELLNDAGAAGNPWAADLASNNTDGTFGGFVQKLLSVAKFLGLK